MSSGARGMVSSGGGGGRWMEVGVETGVTRNDGNDGGGGGGWNGAVGKGGGGEVCGNR